MILVSIFKRIDILPGYPGFGQCILGENVAAIFILTLPLASFMLYQTARG
jgi:hypothetical protein